MLNACHKLHRREAKKGNNLSLVQNLACSFNVNNTENGAILKWKINNRINMLTLSEHTENGK